ncbi:MAG: ATP-grasp domain-containing protein, partial [Gordonia sp. (in: high G+C Gram-positive bacteria)]
PEIGFPVLIKPSAGGGGKGMHRVDDPAELPGALAVARREAASAFGDDTLFLERFVDTPRHIEVQVLADAHGTVIHLGERECSLQRRHQKVIEEAPSSLLDAQTRARIGASACDAARSVGYVGAGTVEFIVASNAPGDFYFMEMNTRLQVEHPVTEMVTGIDLVEQQVRVARGEKLAIAQDDVVLTGHAIEARVYAEDPATGFLPTGGTVSALRWPSGAGVRVDSGVVEGSRIGSDYDPMLAKVIAHGADRAEAIDRLDEALARTALTGLVTNVDFCRDLLGRDDVRAGRLDTGLIDRMIDDWRPTPPTPSALVAATLGALDRGSADDLWCSALGFRLGAPSPIVTRLDWHGTRIAVSALVVESTPDALTADVEITSGDETVEDPRVRATVRPVGGSQITVVCDGVGARWTLRHHSAHPEAVRWVSGPAGTWALRPASALASGGDAEAVGEAVSPMPGIVVAVPAADGDEVTAGDPLVVVEAMKMEHVLRASLDGVAAISVRAGDRVDAQQVVARIVAHDEDAGAHDEKA